MNPQIYTSSFHHLNQNRCDADAIHVVLTLQNAGYIAYLVGGSVRDLLLGLSPKDYDISTSASPEQIKQLFKGQCLLIGKRFRLAHIRVRDKVFEVSTFRSGDNESEQLITRDNVWGTPEEDVLRRDFTINGLFYDPASETIIDFVDGYSDLQKRYLRTIGTPFLRFKQDPVRMIRLLKFKARLGFEIDPQAQEALGLCYLEIIKSSQARIFEEILKMLESGFSEQFIELMHESKFLDLLMPMFSKFLHSLEGEDTLDLLCEIDLLAHYEKVHRSVLISALVFPFLQKTLQKKPPQKPLSPQETYEHVHLSLSAFFHPFFLIPRRLRMQITTVLMLQFKMTPLLPSKKTKLRIPKDPDFIYALQFLKLRSCLDTTLKSVFNRWKNGYDLMPKHHFQKKLRP